MKIWQALFLVAGLWFVTDRLFRASDTLETKARTHHHRICEEVH